MIEKLIAASMASLAQQKESGICAALDKVMPRWTLIDISRRCSFVRYAGDPNEYLLLDGKPIMEFFPLESETVLGGDRYVMRMTQKCREIAA